MSAEAAVAEQTTTFETFDNFDEVEVSDQEQNEDWTSGDDEEVAETKPKDEGLKVLDDTDVDGDGDVVKKEEKKVAKKVEKEEVEEKEEEETSLEDKPISESKEDKVSKKIRMRMGDGELYNVDAESTFKVKVDGELAEVPLQELINNYSGKTAWDKKFTEIGKEKKSLEFEKSQISTKQQKLTDSANKVLGVIKDPNSNPLDAMLNLVEMAGEDPYTVYRRTMEANLEELGKLLDMTETERELYFHKKKDELHGKVQKQRQAKMIEEQSFSQVLQKVEKLRQAHNVSEEQFVDASEELESIYKDAGLDVDSITEEHVVDYASLRPHIAAVKELVAPYEDNISEAKFGDVVAQLARNLRDGKTDKKSISEILKRNFSAEEDVKELNTKIYEKQKAKKPSKSVETESSNGFESFDEF